jgi:DNA-binding NarL/FixJ family response regulator
VLNKITGLLVDDHNLVRRGFRRMLEDESDLKLSAKWLTAARRFDLRNGCVRR